MSGTGSWVTTSTILEGLRGLDDGDAWATLVERFRGPILGFARSMGLGPLDAEDIAQETLATFATAVREGRYDRARGRLSHWLFGIAHNQIRHHRRREARRHHILARDDAEPDEVADPAAARLWEHSWDAFVAEACLRQVRAEFTPETVRAFEHVVLGERSPREVAPELGVDVKAVYNAKHRVLRRVREIRAELERAELAPPSRE